MAEEKKSDKHNTALDCNGPLDSEMTSQPKLDVEAGPEEHKVKRNLKDRECTHLLDDQALPRRSSAKLYNWRHGKGWRLIPQMDFVTNINEIEADSYDDPPPRNSAEALWQWLMSARILLLPPSLLNSIECKPGQCCSTNVQESMGLVCVYNIEPVASARSVFQ